LKVIQILANSFLTYYPLFGFFQELKNRGFYIGIEDYKDLINSLHKGYGLNSLDDLCILCETLWLKNEKDRLTFNDCFNRSIQIQKSRLDHILNPEKETDIQKIEKKEAVEPDFGVSDKKLTDKSDSKSEDSSISEEDKSLQNEDEGFETLYLSMGSSGYKKEIEKDKTVDLTEKKFHFSERNFLPFVERPLQILWRNLRNTQYEPDLENVDVEACIDYFSKNGVLSDIFYTQKTTNITQLITLVDVGGPMKVFKWLSNQLVGIVSSELINKSFYYENVPIPYVFSDINLEKEIEWESFMNTELINKYVIIISDADSVKGIYNDRKIKTISNVVAQIYLTAKNVVWLNPMPFHRWQTSSASKINEKVRMFETTYDGLLKAICYLKNNVQINSDLSDV